MLKLLTRGPRTGPLTGPYPDHPEPAPPAYRGQVMLNTDRCRGDGACMRVCPSAAIAVTPTADGWIWELTDARCVFCGLCAEVCDSGAIVISTEFELAVRDPADLIARVTFTGKGST